MRAITILAAIAWFAAPALAAPHLGDWMSCKGREATSADDRIAACDRVLQTDSLTPDETMFAYISRATAYLSKRDVDHALADVDAATAAAPNLAAPYLLHGSINVLRHDFDKALADFSRAIAVQPNAPEAYNERGAVHLAKKDYAEALRA